MLEVTKPFQSSSIDTLNVHEVLSPQDIQNLMSAIYPNSIKDQYFNTLYFLALFERELEEINQFLLQSAALLKAIQDLEADFFREREHVRRGGPTDLELAELYKQLQNKKAAAEALIQGFKQRAEKLQAMFQEIQFFAQEIRDIDERYYREAQKYLSQCVMSAEGKELTAQIKELAASYGVTAETGACPYYGDATYLMRQEDLEKATRIEAERATFTSNLDEPIQSWWVDRQAILPRDDMTQMIFGMMHHQAPTEVVEDVLHKLHRVDQVTVGPDGRNLSSYLAAQNNARKRDIQDKCREFSHQHDGLTPDQFKQQSLDLLREMTKLIPQLKKVMGGHDDKSELWEIYKNLRMEIKELSYTRLTEKALGADPQQRPAIAAERLEQWRATLETIKSQTSELEEEVEIDVDDDDDYGPKIR